MTRTAAMLTAKEKMARLPPEFRAQIADQRRRDLEAAKAFERVCRDGRADLLSDAAHWLGEATLDGWRLAFLKVARLPHVSPEKQTAFVNVWVEHKMLPLTVGDRRVVADALRVLMPAGYSGPPMTLFRGAGARERRRRMYGFSWTTDVAIAHKFAEHWAQPSIESTGIVLKTLASPEAVLLTRQPEDYYDEGEVVVDPYRLGRVEVVERLTVSSLTVP
jgi:hypothetical protein